MKAMFAIIIASVMFVGFSLINTGPVTGAGQRTETAQKPHTPPAQIQVREDSPEWMKRMARGEPKPRTAARQAGGSMTYARARKVLLMGQPYDADRLWASYSRLNLNERTALRKIINDGGVSSAQATGNLIADLETEIGARLVAAELRYKVRCCTNNYYGKTAQRNCLFTEGNSCRPTENQ